MTIALAFAALLAPGGFDIDFAPLAQANPVRHTVTVTARTETDRAEVAVTCTAGSPHGALDAVRLRLAGDGWDVRAVPGSPRLVVGGKGGRPVTAVEVGVTGAPMGCAPVARRVR